MKNNFKFFVFILVFGLFFPRDYAESESMYLDSDRTISMDLLDANLKDVIKIFSVQSGLNFIASEAVKDRKVTLYLDKVPLKDAMDKIFKANNLSYELDEEANIFIVKDWGTPEAETTTKVFPLKYHSVSNAKIKKEIEANLGAGGEDIISSIKGILSEKGKITEDAKTNSLIITDVPSRFANLEQVIAKLDVLVPQVLIEVEMLDVSKNVVDKMGFQHGNNPIFFVWPESKRGIEFFLGDLTKRGKDIADASMGGLFSLGRTYSEILDFLRVQTDTKYLARPRLLTLNNETAEIKIVTQEAVGEKKSVTGQEDTTTTEAERYETGVFLRVTPQINMETGEITMFIMPSVAEATASGITSSTGVKFYNPEIRSTKSIVRVKDGETVIVGGLIRNELNQTLTKVPILGDIPILGALFRHKDKTKDKERELLVFITPRIVKDTNKNLAQVQKKAALPLREQTAGALFDNREAVIDASLNNYEKK